MKAAKTPSGNKGTARFADINDIRKELAKKEEGPYWGSENGKGIISNFGSNALVVGPSGSGKSVGLVVPMILSIKTSKVVQDFKSELACITANALRQRGEVVHIINIGDINSQILGSSATYNLLALIADNFFHTGGLLDINADLNEFAHQLHSEPEKEGGDNLFFRIGSRELIAFAILICVLIDGPNATLGDVATLLNDRHRLLNHALWACGKLKVIKDPNQDDEKESEEFARMEFDDAPWRSFHDPEDVKEFIDHLRNTAEKISQLLSNPDSKSADSFLTGAQQSLNNFNRATRAFKVTKSTSFRFSDLKEGKKPTTVFIIADPARMQAQSEVIALIQYCMYAEFKRHPDPHTKVHVISDETSNFKIEGLV